MNDNVMGRRKFLRGLIAAPIAVVAVKAMIESKFVPELQAAAVDELAIIEGQTLEHQLMKEALMERGEVSEAGDGKVFVRAPQKVFNPDARIWKSVIPEAEGWAAAIAITHPNLNLQSLQRSTKILARAIDRDIQTEEIKAGTDIIIELPKVLRTWRDAQGRMQAEIAMGLDKIEVRGIEQFKVGYIGNHSEGGSLATSPYGVRQGTRKMADHLKDIKLYQPERQLRNEMAELRAQYSKKQRTVEDLARRRQDEIEAHTLNDSMSYRIAQMHAASVESIEFIENGELTQSYGEQGDDDWFETVAAEHAEYDMGSADGWSKTLSKLLWG